MLPSLEETKAATNPGAGLVPPPAENLKLGQEAQWILHLHGSRLEPRPVDPKAPFRIRIADVRPHGSQLAYDFRFLALEPGTFDLRDYLMRSDGSDLSNVPPLQVEFSGILPPDHDGLLIPGTTAARPFLGGYRIALIAAAVVWILGLAILLRRGRRLKPDPSPPPAPEPTLAEKLRPLLEQAQAGRLSSDGKAHLERLLLAHWRERLGWGELSMEESVRRLRQHPEGGIILRTLEGWLHKRPGNDSADLEPLLAPYRQQPVESENSA